jgi:DNA-binding protein H-NS
VVVLARELGLTADDIFRQKAPAKIRTTRNTRKSTPPKYQSPDNPAETWAGRD